MLSVVKAMMWTGWEVRWEEWAGFCTLLCFGVIKHVMGEVAWKGDSTSIVEACVGATLYNEKVLIIFYVVYHVSVLGRSCTWKVKRIGADLHREMAEAYPPRKKHDVEPLMRLSGLEPLNYKPNLDNMRSTFLKIGERCNVAGSIMYKKAIVDGDYEKAASIATKQVNL
jgi:hypothetical protein